MAARRAPEHGNQHDLVETRDVTDRANPALVEFPGGHGADTPEPLDRKRVEKLQLAVGRHHEQAVGLGDAARHLREKFGPRDSDRDRQTDAVEHVMS